MAKYSDLEYLRLSKGQRFSYKLGQFFSSILPGIGNLFKRLGRGIAGAFGKFLGGIADIGRTFKNGDAKTKASFLVMGFGSIARGQILRGILFLLFEIVFIFYMATAGVKWLAMLPSLGKVGPTKEYNAVLDTYVTTYHDNSFKILLYGVLTIFFIIAFIYTWRVNVRQNKISQEMLEKGIRLRSGKDDLRSLVDESFYKTLLALPLTGILVFTVLPLVFMVLVAFTNYDGANDGYFSGLFHWVGLDNFNQVLSWGSGSTVYSATFGEVLTWTLIWAFFATFSNYFLGMFVAMMINKKGIRFKKGWRTILVLTIAIPQFISLLYVSKMFAKDGIVNGTLLSWGWIKEALPFWTDPTWARITVILINIWIGIPYLMLIATGLRIRQDRRSQRLEAIQQDNSPVHAVHNRTVPAYKLYGQHEQLQCNIPADGRQPHKRGGLLGGRTGGPYGPAYYMAVQDNHRYGFKVLHGVRRGYTDIRDTGDNNPYRLQRTAVGQE